MTSYSALCWLAYLWAIGRAEKIGEMFLKGIKKGQVALAGVAQFLL